MANGQGILKHENGDVYDGQWLYDRAHGFGSYVCKKDGEKYEGDWKLDVPHGNGK